MSFGRNFRMGKEGRYNFSIRAEFQNIFNRLFLSMPATGNQGLGPFGGAAITTSNTPVTTNGVLTGGWGYLNTTAPLGGAAQPRSGQIVGRLTF